MDNTSTDDEAITDNFILQFISIFIQLQGIEPSKFAEKLWKRVWEQDIACKNSQKRGGYYEANRRRSR